MKSLLFLFAFCSFLIPFCDAFADDQPNVIVFLVDDMGVMDTSLPNADEEFYETPNLQKLAERGMTFTNGYCAHPRCVESRFGIQTGRSPYRDGAQAMSAEKVMQNHPTLGEAFLDAGYTTSFFGKWHLGHEEKSFPHNRGYTTNVGGCAAGAVGSHFFPYDVNPNSGKKGKEGAILGLEKGEPGENVTDRLTDEAERWIRSQVEGEKPFFAFISHFAVHTPIQGKPDEVAHFEAKVADLPAAAGENGFITNDGNSKSRRDHPEYASMIKTTDDSLGAILELLDELKITKNTVILFTSDHGGLSNRGLESKRVVATSNLPYRAGKGHLFEGGLRVPFVVAYPALIKPGSKSDVLAVGTDIFPTLVNLAGGKLRPEHHIDGVSLLPTLKGENMERQEYFWHHPRPRPDQTGDQAASVYRDGKFKLVKTYFPEIGYQLYDLKADPYEETDLAEEKPSRVKKMDVALVAQLVEAGAPDLRRDWRNKDDTKPVSAEPGKK